MGFGGGFWGGRVQLSGGMAIRRWSSVVGRRVSGIESVEWAKSPAQRVRCETNKGLLSHAGEHTYRREEVGQKHSNTARNTKPHHLARLALTSTSVERARCTGSSHARARRLLRATRRYHSNSQLEYLVQPPELPLALHSVSLFAGSFMGQMKPKP